MSIIRRRTVSSTRAPLQATTLALAAVLTLSACSGTSETASGAEAPASAGDAAFPRTVEHAMGETEIPEQPERVVVLDTGELDAALSLGVEPVGAVTTDVSEEFLSYLADEAEGVEVVGTIAEPNLEEIAALEPDLILSNKVRHEDIYEQLSQIAPTVFAADLGDTWKENFLLDAEALGKEEEADELLSEYEQNAAELGESLGDAAETTVSPLRFVGGTIRAYQPQSFIGTVLADIGLDQVELPTGEVATFAELSAEELTRGDADVVLYSSYGPAADSGEAAVVAGPLWPRLTAVQSGRAYAVEDDVFYTGIGLMAATLMVEHLAEKLPS
jgi:iron complex transport system substrate-binding protein